MRLTEEQIIGLAKEFFQCEEGLEVGDVVVTDDLIKDFASELLTLQGEKEDYGGIHNLKPAKNWDEDKDQENGNYMNKCIYCKSFFMGHKRRVICKECSKGEPTKDIKLGEIFEVDGKKYAIQKPDTSSKETDPHGTITYYLTEI